MEISLGNKLIAEFMGFEFTKHGNVWVPNLYPKEISKPNSGETTFGLEHLLFHESWDWIMPVVEKIQSMGFKFVIGDSNRVTVYNKDYDWRNGSTEDSLIECVWHGVTQFIIWYNQQSKS